MGAALDRLEKRLARNAEEYYRSMFGGRVLSWNMRDTHMMETLEQLMARPGARGIVWEHNTHIGDARYTDMAADGMVRLGLIVHTSARRPACTAERSRRDDRRLAVRAHVSSATCVPNPAFGRASCLVATGQRRAAST